MTRRREAGVTVVEAAFVVPLLFMFIFGLVDLGMWTLNSNQASNAARDGARAGILAYPLRGVDLVTEDQQARATIVAAIEDHLPEGTLEDSDVTITCLRSDGASVSCTDAGPDRVRVDVAWAWRLVTPVATVLGIDEGAATGSATMEIVGRPLAVAPPGSDPDADDPLQPPETVACKANDLTTPTQVFTKGNQLTAPMTITFTYVEGDCHDLRIVLTGTRQSTSETVTHFCGCGDGPEHSWTYAGSNNIWQNNGKQGKATLMNGSTVLETTEFLVK
jgi:hypothetical protein